VATNDHLYGPALRVACRYVKEHPGFVRALGTSSAHPDHAAAVDIMDKLRNEREIRAYLRTRSFRRWDEALELLVDVAEAWLDGGERNAIAVEYLRRKASGVLDELKRSDRLVHRALFSLAYLDGPRVIAARNFVRTLLESEYGVTLASETVRASYRRLAAAGLIEYTAGQKRPGSRVSTIVDLSPFLARGPVAPVEVPEELLLGPHSLIALSEYRVSRSEARAAWESQRSESIARWRESPGRLEVAAGRRDQRQRIRELEDSVVGLGDLDVLAYLVQGIEL